ncbi:MAG: hypothetical protein ACT4O1_13520 [Gemmatimonadota bacterium]
MKISAYEISRKEANEVRAALRKLVITRVFTQKEIQKAYDLAGAIVGMLTSAIITLEKRMESEERLPPSPEIKPDAGSRSRPRSP